MKRKNIREFGPLRRVLEHIYTYGFYTREDFIREGLAGNARYYDDVIRQLRDLYYLDEAQEQEPPVTSVSSGKYKRYQFRRDYFSGQSRELEAVFGLHSAKEYEIYTILYCLTLACGRGGASVAATAQLMTLGGAIPLKINKQGTESVSDCVSTVSRRFKDLRDSGYLRAEGRSNLPADPCGLYELSDRELTDLYMLASFCSGAAYPRVGVAFLRDALCRHLRFRGIPIPPEMFLFRDSASGNLLDEEIVHRLAQSRIRSHKVRIRCGKKSMDIAPVFLRVDTRNGRWYLIALKGKTPVMMRVSNIDEVTEPDDTDLAFDMPAAEAAVRDAFQYNYISGRVGPTVLVEAELHFDNDAIRRQFERELLIGSIERRGNQEYYQAMVSDVSELRPILRAYGPWLKILPGDGHQLGRELQEEYERMLQKYGSIQ